MLLADALIDSVRTPWIHYSIHLFFEFFISLLAIFLILLVLVQRGRGGGIAGALGGMGGNSAFGTKAGDTFTWITYGTAAVWILLAMLTIKTFTDPHQDKARIAAQQEEAEEEPGSDIDIGGGATDKDPADKGDTKPEDTKMRSEEAFFEDPSTTEDSQGKSSGTKSNEKTEKADPDLEVPEGPATPSDGAPKSPLPKDTNEEPSDDPK